MIESKFLRRGGGRGLGLLAAAIKSARKFGRRFETIFLPGVKQNNDVKDFWREEKDVIVRVDQYLECH